jgi:hypothetical protein
MRHLNVESDSQLDEMIKESLDDSSTLLIWPAMWDRTTRRSALAGIEKHVKYAYLTTLVGVVLATVTTAYTVMRSFMVSRRFGPNFPGNFTGTREFGNFTRTSQFANINPYGGFVNDLAILAVVIAIFGVLWLGLSLRTPRT